MDGRWNHLRDVAGVSVILGTAVLPGSSSLFRWACFDRRQNHLRDVAGQPVSLPKPSAQALYRARRQRANIVHDLLKDGIEIKASDSAMAGIG